MLVGHIVAPLAPCRSARDATACHHHHRLQAMPPGLFQSRAGALVTALREAGICGAQLQDRPCAGRVPVGTGGPITAHLVPTTSTPHVPPERAQTQRRSPGVVTGILGRAWLARSRSCGASPLLPPLSLLLPRGLGGAAVEAGGHRHPPSIPPSARLSRRGPVLRVSPSFHCSNNLFSTRGAKGSPLAPARASIFSCL